MGLSVDVESRTSDGRMDMVLMGLKAIYVIEFKYGSTPEAALSQINAKKYAMQYAMLCENSLNDRRIVKVGVNISPETRNMDGWIIE